MGGKRSAAAKVEGEQFRAHLHCQLRKTKLCVYNLRGNCNFGASCNFAHASDEMHNAPDLQRTKLCANFANSRCNDPSCTYAHGEAELRATDTFYKRSTCIWYGKGTCKNGESCRFAHGAAELRRRLGTAGDGPDVAPLPVGRADGFTDLVSRHAARVPVEMSAAEFVKAQIVAEHAAAEISVLPKSAAQHQQSGAQRRMAKRNLPGHAAPSAQRADPEALLSQQWPRQHEQPSISQRAMQQQWLGAQQQFEIPISSTEPMKVIPGSIAVPPHLQWSGPPAVPYGNVPYGLDSPYQTNAAVGDPATEAFATLVALQGVASRLNSPQHGDANFQSEIGMLCSSISAHLQWSGPPAVPHGNVPYGSDSPYQTNGAVGDAANEAFATLAALQGVASRLNGPQHGDANFQSEIGRLCSSISALSAQCDNLKHRVRLQLGDPHSAASSSTTAFSHNISTGLSESEGFSRQASSEEETALLAGGC